MSTVIISPIGPAFQTYREWNVFEINMSDGQIKIAATRYEFGDLRSPVVHKNFMPRPGDDTVGRRVAITKVHQMIDQIEEEGFDAFMARKDEWNTGISFSGR